MSASIKPKKTLEIIDPMELKKRMAAKERCVLRAIQPFQIVLIISVVSCLFWFYSLLSTIQYAIDAAKSLRDDQHIFHDGLQQVPDLVKGETHHQVADGRDIKIIKIYSTCIFSFHSGLSIDVHVRNRI